MKMIKSMNPYKNTVYSIEYLSADDWNCNLETVNFTSRTFCPIFLSKNAALVHARLVGKRLKTKTRVKAVRMFPLKQKA